MVFSESKINDSDVLHTHDNSNLLYHYINKLKKDKILKSIRSNHLLLHK